MRAQIEERLQSLKAEFKTGQEMLASMESSLANTRSTLMRISGAIQILEELLEPQPRTGRDSSTDAPPERAVAS